MSKIAAATKKPKSSYKIRSTLIQVMDDMISRSLGCPNEKPPKLKPGTNQKDQLQKERKEVKKKRREQRDVDGNKGTLTGAKEQGRTPRTLQT